MIFDDPEARHIAHHHHRPGSFGARTLVIVVTMAVHMRGRGSGPGCRRRCGFASQDVPPANWSRCPIMDQGVAGNTQRVSFLQFFYISLTCNDFLGMFYHEVSMRLPRFYPILDVATVSRRGLEVVFVAQQILDAGARILQFRHKRHFSRSIFEDLTRVSEMCRRADALLVVNDRADIACLMSAALHLGQDDLLPSEARTITGPNTQIGYSTHNEQQLLAAISQPADYVALGPIFGTASKENPDPEVGIAELRRLRPLTTRPLVAIGGITRANAAEVMEAGADSVAIISDLFDGADVRARAKEWLDILGPDGC